MTFDWTRVRDGIRSSAIQNLGSGKKATVVRPAKTPNQPIPGVEVERSGLNEEELRGNFDAVLTKKTMKLGTGNVVRERVDVLILSPGEFVPKGGDTATFGGTSMKIMSVDTPQPDGETAIVHICRVEL